MTIGLLKSPMVSAVAVPKAGMSSSSLKRSSRAGERREEMRRLARVRGRGKRGKRTRACRGGV
jgi:hypothetical protein